MGSMRNHAAHIEDALAANKAAKHALVASWQRSKSVHHLEPGKKRPPERLSAHELDHARQKLGSLLPIARASLDRLYKAVGNVGCCVLLADKNGVPVARRGAIQDDKTFNRWGLWTGAIWSEDSEGTNGIGTCIIEERALTIHKSQHYHSKNAGLSCTAAPIFDHQGRLIAALDVSSCRADLTAEFANLISIAVGDAACRIEIEHFRQSFATSRILLATSKQTAETTPSTCKASALLAVNEDDLVIGATRQARRLYGLSDDDLQNPLPLSTLNGQNVDEAQDYAMAEHRIIQQALARTGGNISQAAKSMGISRATLHRKINRFKKQI